MVLVFSRGEALILDTKLTEIESVIYMFRWSLRSPLSLRASELSEYIFVPQATSLAKALLCVFLLGTSQSVLGDEMGRDPALVYFNDHVLANEADEQGRSMKEGYVDINGTRYHYVEAGEGTPVVFYHGFPGFWYIWKFQLLELSQHYRVIAIDGLGANLSDKPIDIESYDIERLAADLLVFTERVVGDQSYALVGHDWGGALSWAFAQTNPPNLDKLVVIAAPPYNQLLKLLATDEKQREASAYINRLKMPGTIDVMKADRAKRLWQIGGYDRFVGEGILTREESELFRTALAREGAARGGLNWYTANVPEFSAIDVDNYWPSEFAKTKVESLLIWGKKDTIFVPDFLQELQNYAANVRIEELEDYAHVPQLRDPSLVNDLLMDFISRPNKQQNNNADRSPL